MHVIKQRSDAKDQKLVKKRGGALGRRGARENVSEQARERGERGGAGEPRGYQAQRGRRKRVVAESIDEQPAGGASGDAMSRTNGQANNGSPISRYRKNPRSSASRPERACPSIPVHEAGRLIGKDIEETAGQEAAEITYRVRAQQQ